MFVRLSPLKTVINKIVCLGSSKWPSLLLSLKFVTFILVPALKRLFVTTKLYCQVYRYFMMKIHSIQFRLQSNKFYCSTFILKHICMLMGKMSNCSWYNQAGQEIMTVIRVTWNRMIMRGCGRDDTQGVVTGDVFSLLVEKLAVTSKITKNSSPHQFNVILDFRS